FWSLAIEEHFYLFWPLAVFVCKPKRLVVVSVILFVISKLLALSFSLFDLNWVTIYTFTFTRMDALLAGGFIAIVSRRNKAILEKNVTWLLVVVSLLMVAFYTYIFIGNRYQFTLSLIMVTAINSSYSLILLFNTLLCTCILILSLSRNVISEFLKHKILKFFGRISYGLYMIHFPVFMIFNERLIVFFQPYVKSLFLSEVISSLICASAAIIIANISYRYFESRFINLKERFPATSKL
nr:acyltransferase [Bacteroidota bacterium]